MNSYTLITGASSGIGLATAEKFADEGRNLILIARRKDKLESLAKRLERGVDVITGVLDVTDSKALEAFFKTTLKGISIDCVVNNAGLALNTEQFQDVPLSDAQTMVDVNISAFLHIAHLSIPFLKKTKGHLVNLGSLAGWEQYGGGAVYCATKSFVHAFTRGLRQDLLGTGIRVTTIAPGKVDTEFSLVRFKGDKKKSDAVYSDWRHLKAVDIADAIWYAVSRPSHVNLEHLLVMPTDQAGSNVVK